AAPVVVRALLVPPLGWDAITLHAVKAGSWVQAGTLLPLVRPRAWSAWADHPPRRRLFATLPLLAVHGDLFLGLVGPSFSPRLAAIGWAIARELGVREPWGTTAAGLVLAIPTLRLEVGACYVELPLVCAFGAGALFAIRFLRRGEAGALVLAAAGFGLACAAK